MMGRGDEKVSNFDFYFRSGETGEEIGECIRTELGNQVRLHELC